MTTAFQDGNTQNSASLETPAESSQPSSPSASSVFMDDELANRKWFSRSHDDTVLDRVRKAAEQEDQIDPEEEVMEDAANAFQNARFRHCELALLLQQIKERNDLSLKETRKEFEELMNDIKKAEEEFEEVMKKIKESGEMSGPIKKFKRDWRFSISE
ncbi:predicted protein [Sclerotinia sclerotiorum 1980 UF-70]|nr:predicted protein [Sclerotinia sclerotiorum 1980 UF-70]EDN93181.1 predicted protein [Sclerotinia sclerotiorum 1980 UF-70]